MKQIFLICFSLTLTLQCFSQEVNDIKKVPPISKGKIMLIDGTTFQFSKLEVKNDTVICTDPQLNIYRYPGAEVHKISKNGSYAGAGAIAGGFAGLFGSLIVTYNWSKDGVHSGTKTPFIAGATLFCAAIGGWTGALIKKDKTIYKNYTAFSFGLDYDSFIVSEPAVMLTLKINL